MLQFFQFQFGLRRVHPALLREVELIVPVRVLGLYSPLSLQREVRSLKDQEIESQSLKSCSVVVQKSRFTGDYKARLDSLCLNTRLMKRCASGWSSHSVQTPSKNWLVSQPLQIGDVELPDIIKAQNQHGQSFKTHAPSQNRG